MSSTVPTLHGIIKTLSKSEKRYFKLFASRTTAENDERPIRLFDLIDKQDEAPEDSRLKKDSGAGSEQGFMALTRQLNDVLLKSLHAFHEEKTPEPKIRAQLHYTELLLAKGLEKHARQQLKVARDLARKHELLEYLPAVLELELAMADKDNREQQYKKAQLFYEEYCDVLKKLEVQALYGRRLKQITLMAARSPFSRSKSKDFSDLDAFLALPEIRQEQGPSTVRAQFFYNDIHVVASYIRADYNKMYFFSSRLVRLAQEHPDVLQYETEKYVSILNRHASACAMLRLPHELLATASLLRKINTTDERQKVRIFMFATNADFNNCVLSKDRTMTSESLARFEAGYPQYGKRLDALYGYLLPAQAAMFSFFLGDPERALRWTEIALRSSGISGHEEIFLFVRFTELQCLYELKQFERLSQRLRMFYRYLKGKKALYRIEQALIDNIKQLAGSTSENKEKEFFSGLRESIANALRESPEDKRFFSNNADLLAWFDSKVSDQPLLGLVTDEEESPAKGKKKGSRKK